NSAGPDRLKPPTIDIELEPLKTIDAIPCKARALGLVELTARPQSELTDVLPEAVTDAAAAGSRERKQGCARASLAGATRAQTNALATAKTRQRLSLRTMTPSFNSASYSVFTHISIRSYWTASLFMGLYAFDFPRYRFSRLFALLVAALDLAH